MNTGMYIAIGLMLFLFGFSIQISQSAYKPTANKNDITNKKNNIIKPMYLAYNQNNEVLLEGDKTYFELNTFVRENYAYVTLAPLKPIDAQYSKQ